MKGFLFRVFAMIEYSKYDIFFFRSNVIGIVKLRDFALITPEQHDLTVQHVLEFHNRM